MNTLACYLVSVCLFLSVFEGEGYVYGYGYGGGYGGGYGRGFGWRRPFAGRPFLRGAAFGAGAATGAAIAGRFVGRRKRAAEDLPVEEDNLTKAMEYLELAKQFDVDECLEKTMCEIMAEEESEMSTPIVKMLNAFYEEDRRLFQNPEFVHGYRFLEAGLLGKQKKSKKACAVAYKSCTRDTKEIREEFRAARARVENYDLY